jgi:hypothetical protein
MEKFMFLFRGGKTHPHNANESKEATAYIQRWITWMQGLGQQGILAGGDSLNLNGKQVKGQSKVVTNEPFIVATEMVNGYLVVNAKDIDEAVEISKGCPIFEEDGSVEVRQVQKQN